MKKQGIPILVILTVAFSAFTLGFYFGKNRDPQPVTLSVPAVMQTVPPATAIAEASETIPEPTITFPIDINRAGIDEFSALPGIGDVLARRILDYREENGKFAAVEDLLNVKGIGKLRFEEIIDLITIGG